LQRGARNIERLNPRSLFNHFSEICNNKKCVLDEVESRRLVSTLYLALFNYWSEKAYNKGLRGKGEGPFGDDFSYYYFLQVLFQAGLTTSAKLLHIYRVAADHYTLNPTKIKLKYFPQIGEIEVKFNSDIIKQLLVHAYKILDFLENNY